MTKKQFIKNKAVAIYSQFFMFIFRVFPIKKNKIIMSNFRNKGYGDSPKVIADKLINDGENVKIYWATKTKNISSLPQGVHFVKFLSIKYFYHLATAKVWVNNYRVASGITKRKGQYYIQTWHSSLRLKKIEKDAGKILGNDYIKTAKKDSKKTDLIISGNTFSTNIYKNAFWYNGRVLECGIPRCDIFFDKSHIQKTREKIIKKYKIPSDNTIILYAPTFRKSQNEADSYLDFKEITKKLGKKYTILVRMHPNSRYNYPTSYNVVNVTNYSDMQDLICASDCLITDYSGCCFDMMFKGGACIIYAEDIQEYLSKERDLYFDFKKDLPFPITTGKNELIDKIKNFNYNEYNDKVKEFSKKVGLCERGVASKTICDIIMKEISGKKYKIGYTTGVFDMFHIGHLNILRQAKEQCDYLIVGVSTDELVQKTKNKTPIIPFEDRCSIVEAIKYVDQVVPQYDKDKLAAQDHYNYDVMFVGDDWKGKDLFVKAERELKKRGVDVVYFPYTKKISSTILREKINQKNGEKQ